MTQTDQVVDDVSLRQPLIYTADGKRASHTPPSGTRIDYNYTRLTQIGNALKTRDGNGNLLDDGKNQYTYDAQNHLIQANDSNGKALYTPRRNNA